MYIIKDILNKSIRDKWAVTSTINSPREGDLLMYEAEARGNGFPSFPLGNLAFLSAKCHEILSHYFKFTTFKTRKIV